MDSKAATCARCGSLVPHHVAACATCGEPRTTPEADTQRRVTGEPPDPDTTQTGGERSEEARFRIGEKLLGHYVVVRQLGRGGMGTVYLAKDDVSGQEVAVKVLPAALARERDIRERFVQEARALATMDHPSIVPLVTFAQEGEDRFLVMKYIPGEPLDARIRRLGVLGPDEARTILRALLSALGFAHQRGVIHRDVKPSNLIIEGDLAAQHRIFLVDFGISKKEESKDKLTQTGMLMGTPQYMSPEQISGHTVDGRADLYAAGLVLFEMLCGRPPFDGQKTFQVLRAHVEQPVPDMRELRGSEIPDDLVSLTHLLLAKDPSDRPRDAGAAIELLDGTGTFPAVRPASALVAAPTPATLRMPKPAPTTRVTPGFSDGDIRSDAQLEDPSAAEIRALGGRERPAVVALLFVLAIGAGAAFVLLRSADLGLEPVAPRSADAGPAGLVDAQMKASLLISSGRVALGKNDLDNARITADAAVDIAPQDPDAHLLRVEVLIRAKALPDAAAALERTRALAGLTDEHRAIADGLSVALAEAEKKRAEVSEAAERDRKERDRRERERGRAPSSLSTNALEAITQGTKAAFQRCYEDEVLKKHPKAFGGVVITARVAPSGKVESVSVDAPAKLQRGSFVSCVRQAAQTWRFPAWQGSAESYRHKVNFRPG